MTRCRRQLRRHNARGNESDERRATSDDLKPRTAQSDTDRRVVNQRDADSRSTFHHQTVRPILGGTGDSQPRRPVRRPQPWSVRARIMAIHTGGASAGVQQGHLIMVAHFTTVRSDFAQRTVDDVRATARSSHPNSGRARSGGSGCSNHDLAAGRRRASARLHDARRDPHALAPRSYPLPTRSHSQPATTACRRACSRLDCSRARRWAPARRGLSDSAAAHSGCLTTARGACVGVALGDTGIDEVLSSRGWSAWTLWHPGFGHQVTPGQLTRPVAKLCA